MSEASTINYADREQVRLYLDSLRLGFEIITDANGAMKKIRRPAHLVNRDIFNVVHTHLEARGEIFAAPQPYYFDRIDHRLIRLLEGDANLAQLLRELGLLPTEPHTKLVSRALADIGNSAEHRTVHRLAFFGCDAIYIRATETTMLKVTATDITEVPLGTDDVILIADDLGDWPSLAELEPYLESLRPQMGTTCTQIRPDLPLAKLTTRWADDCLLNAEQQWQMAFTRATFIFAASRYSTWPILLLTGEGGSGKSTFFELLLSLLVGEPTILQSLPSQERSLVALLTKSSIAALDNVDGAGLDRPDRSSVNDLICQASTGAKISIARLFNDNVLDTYRLRLHTFFTCRVNPFDRDDVMRRTIELQMATPTEDGPDKDALVRAFLADRAPMLAELLLRLQNIVRAHDEHGAAEFHMVTKMKEYEKFTYVCSAFEERLSETKNLWASYMQRYRRSITETDPLVHAVRLWLGKGGNDGRQVSPTTLFTELQTIFADLEQVFTYKSPSAFGRNVAKHRTSLRTIGFSEVPTRGNQDYVFHPSADELALCKRLYTDLRSAILRRPVGAFSPRPSSSYLMPEPGPGDLDDIDSHAPSKREPLK
ncbi:hypothetical protein JAO29_15525 [Edaphobacter sp. HDX4]|uniref:hypothetical protein n=1 Tax=Edaphobacter sp. HDX4 TaxID=2794064 RepID=UPI002FE56341